MRRSGLIGRKIGMTRLFTDEGLSVPITVIEVGHNRVTQIKKSTRDGYNAVQLAFGTRRLIRLSKAEKGHLAKAGVESAYSLHEFPLDADEGETIKLGQEYQVDFFQVGQKVDVQGFTIGKGYAGTIKRHHFASGRASHGNSRAHNVPGSIGMAQDPGRVFPGKRMTGRLGGVRRMMQNLVVMKLDIARGLLMLKGAVPGAKGQELMITHATKISSDGRKRYADTAA